MVVESHACPSCAESVPPGRLSCPHCGTVLAAVARRVELAPAPTPSFAPAAAFEPPDARASNDEDAEEPTLEPEPEPYAPWPMAPTAAPPDAAAPLTPVPSPFATAGTYVPPAFAPAEPEPIEPEPFRPGPVELEPVELEAVEPEPVQPVATAPASLVPGDVPPAPVYPRVWDPAGAAAGEGVIAAPAPTAMPRLAGFSMPRIDRDRVEEAADAMMLVGTFGLVLAFLAPWARVVIGSRGTGYMDSWGLAGSGHIALFLLALAVLGLAVVQNPIGRWLRTGVLGIALGSFVLGLAWPYVVGPLGAGPGALLAWVSGLVMFIAGAVSLLVLRHAALSSDV
jgi:hypothetical protein